MTHEILRTIVEGTKEFHLVYMPHDKTVAWTDAHYSPCSIDIAEKVEAIHCPGLGKILRAIEHESEQLSIESFARTCGVTAYDIYRYFHDNSHSDPRDPKHKSREIGSIAKSLALRIAPHLLIWRTVPNTTEMSESHYTISLGEEVARTINSICAPRWIAVISTLSKDGVSNLAPYSCSQFVAYKEPCYIFGAQGYSAERGFQDTVQNILDTKRYVVNLATYSWAEQMNKTAIEAPPWFDEFDYAGLTKGISPEGWPPFVVESPVHMYCDFLNVTDSPALSPQAKNIEVRGRIVRTEIIKSVVRADGSVDTLKLDPVARLGGPTSFVRVARGDEMHLVRPRWPQDVDPSLLEITTRN